MSERVAIDILVQTGIHFRLFMFSERALNPIGSVLQGERNSVKSTYALLDDDRDL